MPMPDPQQARPDSNDPVLVFEDVWLRFDQNEVLNNVSFQLAAGETRVLLGPAGVGKSVLLKLANGLMQPDRGRILLFGQDIATLSETEMLALRGRVGMVFQESALFDSMTVEANVGYRLEEEHTEPAELHKRVVEVLQFVGLEHTLQKVPSELSGGMRRRVAIARAIINRPDLLLYDSPTGGLDPITSTTIMELVVKQRDFYGTSSLLVTHRLQDAFLLATHRYDKAKDAVEKIPDGGLNDATTFMVLNEHEIAFEGSTQELVHSDNPFVKEYLR